MNFRMGSALGDPCQAPRETWDMMAGQIHVDRTGIRSQMLAERAQDSYTESPLPGYLPLTAAWGTPGPIGGQGAHLLLFQGQPGARSAAGRRAGDWGPSQAVETTGQELGAPAYSHDASERWQDRAWWNVQGRDSVARPHPRHQASGNTSAAQTQLCFLLGE